MFEKLYRFLGIEKTKWEDYIDHYLFIDTGIVKEAHLVDITTSIYGKKLLEFYIIDKERYEYYYEREVELVSDLGIAEYELTEKGVQVLRQLIEGGGGD